MQAPHSAQRGHDAAQKKNEVCQSFKMRTCFCPYAMVHQSLPRNFLALLASTTCSCTGSRIIWKRIMKNSELACFNRIVYSFLFIKYNYADASLRSDSEAILVARSLEVAPQADVHTFLRIPRKKYAWLLPTLPYAECRTWWLRGISLNQHGCAGDLLGWITGNDNRPPKCSLEFEGT